LNNSQRLLQIVIYIALTLFAGFAGTSAYAKKPADKDASINAGVCDGLKNGTPGLHGLCVGFCEAQKCTATYDPVTDEVTFDSSCKPSASRLLDNYNKRAGAGDPPMPCVNIVENECPCWTSDELGNIADKTPQNSCNPMQDVEASMFGRDAATGGVDYALVNSGLFGNVSVCLYVENTPRTSRVFQLQPGEQSACVTSIKKECELRALGQ
jgi:hypothetical protein